MRYGYFGYDQRKTSLSRIDFEYIAFTAVNTELGGPEKYKDRLHEWALTVLRTGGHETGLYSFSYCTMNEYDEPEKLIAEHLIAWDGTEEVTN